MQQDSHMDGNAAERLTLEMIKRFGVDAARIARELYDIAEALLDISDISAEMIKRFGGDAVHISHEMADITEGILGREYVKAWHDIADAVKRYDNNRCPPSKYRHVNDNDQKFYNPRPRCR